MPGAGRGLKAQVGRCSLLSFLGERGRSQSSARCHVLYARCFINPSACTSAVTPVPSTLEQTDLGRNLAETPPGRQGVNTGCLKPGVVAPDNSLNRPSQQIEVFWAHLGRLGRHGCLSLLPVVSRSLIHLSPSQDDNLLAVCFPGTSHCRSTASTRVSVLPKGFWELPKCSQVS